MPQQLTSNAHTDMTEAEWTKQAYVTLRKTVEEVADRFTRYPSAPPPPALVARLRNQLADLGHDSVRRFGGIQP